MTSIQTKQSKVKMPGSMRQKLMAAAAMLLVAAILLVSSTYAWFTLSTAPEITGITTSVGANGNLEMALLNPDGDLSLIKTGVGDSMNTPKDAKEANLTWGNLVDLKEGYGFDKIMLNPARLNLTNDGKINVAAPLSYAAYGTDGRVTELLKDSVTAIYNNGFESGTMTKYGVRAIGTANGMSAVALDLRNAKTEMNAGISGARSQAVQTLNQYGADLAQIALKHGTAAAGTDTYTDTEKDTIAATVTGLETSAGKIKTALQNAVVAYYAANVSADDTYVAIEPTAVSFTVSDGTVTIQIADKALPTTIGTALDAAIIKLDAIETAVKTAKAKLDGMTGGNYTWDAISAPLKAVMSTESMTVNGVKVDSLGTEDAQNSLANAILKDGMKLEMPAGSGAFADIASLCGDYAASVTIAEIKHNSLAVTNVPAQMKTIAAENATPAVTPLLSTVSTSVKALDAAEGLATSAAISDTYGYALDLAFRTNAAGSNLLLRQEAAQRIYADGKLEDTLGGGSYMMMNSVDDKFSNDSVKTLMGAIRVVFADKDGSILGVAALDTATATIEAEGVKAKIKLLKEDAYTLSTAGADAGKLVVNEEKEYQDTQSITSLNQNDPKAISVYVYLDGDTVDNAKVANAAKSMTGSMNLQFASSATLTPMNYTPLNPKD